MPDTIPTPSFGLNYVLGGGLWTDRITTFWGNFSSGKTTLSLMIMAEAQKMGYAPIVVVGEPGYTDEYAEKCGLVIEGRNGDVKNGRILVRSNEVEEVAKKVLPYMKNEDEKYVILVDSISSMTFEDFHKTDDGGKAIGGNARAQKWLTMKLTSHMHRNVMVIYIAQQSTGMTSMGGYNKANMGQYVDHMNANIVKLFTSNSKEAIERDDDNRIISQEITWTIDKSKQAAIKGIKGTYWWNPDEVSFDTRKEMFHYGVRCGVIQKSGAWFTFGDKKAHGEKNLFAMLDDNDWELIGNSIFFVANNDYEDDE